MHISFKKISVDAQAYVKFYNMMTHIADFQLICHGSHASGLTSFFIKIVMFTGVDTAWLKTSDWEVLLKLAKSCNCIIKI